MSTLNFRLEFDNLRRSVATDPATQLSALAALRDSVRDDIGISESELARIHAERAETECKIATAEKVRNCTTAAPPASTGSPEFALLQTLYPDIVGKWLAEEERIVTSSNDPTKLSSGLAMIAALSQQIADAPDFLSAFAGLPLTDMTWRAELTEILPLERELRRRVIERQPPSNPL